MIGRIVGMLVGRKLKEKAVDAVLDKVNLPDPVENAIKVAATGNVGDLLGGMGKDMGREAVLGAITKRGKKK
jgi:pyruvate carboxylase